MQLEPDPDRLYRHMRKIGLATLPLNFLLASVIGIAFGVVPGIAIGLLAISFSVYLAFAFPHVNETLRRRIST